MGVKAARGHGAPRLGMVLKGYPRISESFISQEIALLESMGMPIEIYSLRRPRESFTHESVRRIRASVTYLPEYVLPHPRAMIAPNLRLWVRLGPRYVRGFRDALRRAVDRRTSATLRHFLQGGYLAYNRLMGRPVRHLHAHFCHTPTSVAFFASQLSGVPYSFTAHAKDIYTSDPNQLRRKIQRARFVVTCTAYNARYLQSLLNTGAGDGSKNRSLVPIHTIYHGIDLRFFAYGTDPWPAPPFRVLSVGRLVPKKGYDDLLRALKILETLGVDFHFDHIGSGEDKEKIHDLARRLGLWPRVTFHGTLPHEKVIGFYRRSHVFVLACKTAPNGDRDGIPNVLVEAMAVGLPVVSTRHAAIAELVEDQVTGTLVPPASPDTLAWAIKAVLEAGTSLEAQKRAARRTVETHFDSRRCIQPLEALLRKAVGNP
ncbi:glycosyltransferase [Desulfosoma caldarium]|uniref:Glycosyltransferase involved in cell wall biosynthesis n=1 Tax=Desulfosoma caldarium TaxID=610254 RepID=A0A3N1ULI8_9BACT|nr:glycosyltransferase [Desulfosoma caldarium]ROQ90953.1 glycosyltransferase involved in cell wall biosynthesis [Desulfosoma caldarium]